MSQSRWDICLFPFHTSAIQSCMFLCTTSHLPLSHHLFFPFFLPPLRRLSVRTDTSCTHSGLCIHCSLSKVKHTHVCVCVCVWSTQTHRTRHTHAHIADGIKCSCGCSSCACCPIFIVVHFLMLDQMGSWAWIHPIIVNLKWQTALVCASVENMRCCMSTENYKKRNKTETQMHNDNPVSKLSIKPPTPKVWLPMVPIVSCNNM